jgi:hypothetical protein
MRKSEKHFSNLFMFVISARRRASCRFNICVYLRSSAVVQLLLAATGAPFFMECFRPYGLLRDVALLIALLYPIFPPFKEPANSYKFQIPMLSRCEFQNNPQPKTNPL